MVNRVIIIFLVITVLLGAFSSKAAAATPYDSYNYDYWGLSVNSPAGYVPGMVIDGKSLGIGDFNAPGDLFVDRNTEHIYILDSGNRRIIALNSEYKVEAIIERFYSDDREETLNNPTGIYVDNEGMIYIADRDNGRVVVSEPSGRIVKIIGKPDTDLLPADYNYLPEKVAVGSRNMMYVTAYGMNKGIMLFDGEGRFKGFFGSPGVEFSIELLQNYFWKRFLTTEQRRKMKRIIPVDYSNLFADEKGFMYACVKGNASSKNQVNLLNFLGDNTLDNLHKSTQSIVRGNRYGDLEVYYTWDASTQNTFTDITADEKGVYSILDSNNGKVFQYDKESNLLFIFGETGWQKGAFKLPTAIENFKGKILVLDSVKNSITVFTPTTFGEWVHKAIELYDEGLYQEALVPWNEILKMNINYELAHIGIAKIYMRQGRYSDAMRHYKLGNDRNGYSEAYRYYRRDKIREYFPVIGIVSVLFLAALFLIIRRRWKRGHNLDLVYDKMRAAKLSPFTTLFHPIEGFESMKWQKNGSIIYSVMILAALFITKVVNSTAAGFIFSRYRPQDYNIFNDLASTVIVFFIFVVANWSLCTLMEGEGKFLEIWNCVSYAGLPLVLFSVLNLVLSNVLTANESFLLTVVNICGNIWFIVLLVNAIKSIHQFSILKTCAAITLSAVGIGVILALAVLAYSLFQQIYIFVVTVYNEIMFRL